MPELEPDQLCAAVFTAVFTYWVEIMHAEVGSADWVHIHNPGWETTTSYSEAWVYALEVCGDHHPDACVRVVETSPDFPTRYIPVPSR